MKTDDKRKKNMSFFNGKYSYVTAKAFMLCTMRLYDLAL